MKKSLVFVIFLLVAGVFVYQKYFVYKVVPVSAIAASPKAYDQTKLLFRGVVIENRGGFYNSRYMFIEQNSNELIDVVYRDKIALGTAKEKDDHLSSLVSYIYDGKEYTEIDRKIVIVNGTMIYLGEVYDAPEYYIEIDKIKLGR